MNAFLENLDRQMLIKAVAIYLVVYAALNACWAPLAAFAGGVISIGSGMSAAMLQEAGMDSIEGAQEAIAAAGSGALVGAGLVVVGLVALVSIPVLLAAAYGLYRRTRWARMLTVVALGLTVVLSLLSISGSIGNILWLAVSAFLIYMFLTDDAIKLELAG